MLLQQEIKTTETREVSLPYHAKEVGFASSVFYRINKDESLLQITIMENEYALISVSKTLSDHQIQRISKATACPAFEVEQAKNNALEIMDRILQPA